jgi:NADH-quinone oxidoreductase subunit N
MNPALSINDFYSLSPFLIVLAGALILLLIETFVEKFAKSWSFFITLTILLCSIFATIYAPISKNVLLSPWLRFDSLAQFFTLFFLSVGIGSTLLSAPFFHKFPTSQGEYYFLLLSALFGLLLIGQAADFLILFLGLETLSISLYILCGYMKKWTFSQEASMKYFLMGALAAAFLVYGIALIYGATGTTRFDALLPSYQALVGKENQTLFLSGIALVTLGLAFKAAIVPFHVWAPDVYDGAPTPITAFMAVGTKAGAFAAFVIVFLLSLPQFNLYWNQGIALLAYPTLIYANFVALRQVQLRRFFAYSGISHAGFLLIPVAAGGPEAIPALLFYLVIYGFATMGAFAVLAFLDNKSQGVMLHDLTGLFRKSPFLAAILTLCLLTLAGIPPTVGFFAKFYIFKIAFEAGFYVLVVVALLTTILSAYYYLRIISYMFNESRQTSDSNDGQLQGTWSAALMGIISLVGIITLTCYPAPFLDFLNAK